MIDLDIVAQYWKVWQFNDWKKIKIPILPKNSVLGDNKRFGLVVTNSKNSVNTFFFLFFAFRIILHIIKKSQKKKSAQRNSLWKFSHKFAHLFFVMHTFAKAIIILFFVYWTWLNGLKKKLRFFRAGITALVAKAFWQWISKIHYFKGFVDDNRGGGGQSQKSRDR